MKAKLQHWQQRFVQSAVTALLVVSAAASASVALADTVHLTNGRTLDGRAVVEDNGDVALYSSMGVIRLPKSKVAKIDRSDTAEDQILARLDQLQSPSADDLYELAFEANRRGASTLARDLFREALRLNPEHAATLQALNAKPAETAERQRKARTETSKGKTELEAEQLKLLRALRAQADAARVAELQRQLLLAAQLEAQAARDAATEPNLYPVSTYGQVYWPANPVTVVERTQPQRRGASAPHQAAPRRQATQPQRPQRKNAIRTKPRPQH